MCDKKSHDISKSKEMLDSSNFIVIPSSTFDLFIKLGKKGANAYFLYNFLLTLSKESYEFTLNEFLIKENLGWDRIRYYKNRKILINMGLLVTRQGTDENNKFTNSYIEINTQAIDKSF